MLKVLLDPSRSALYFGTAIAIGYGLVALFFYANNGQDPSYTRLATIAFIGALTVVISARLTFSRRGEDHRFIINFETLIALIWLPFVAAVAMIVVTAPAIPLITALQGGSADLLAVQREEFLKGRAGFAAIFVYLNAFFTGALVPYSIALMFQYKFRWRWLLTSFFLVYSMSFVEKAFFIKAMAPLIYLFGVGHVRSILSPKMTLIAAFGILLFVTTISGSGGDLSAATSGSFFDSNYAPGSPIMHIVWRSIAVPLFTAADSLTVFNLYFFNEALNGATSSFLAAIFRLERIPYELIVFQFQWGQNETGTGSSNAVYLIEAFVNYGYAGVFLFSLAIGRAFRLFSESRSEAFRAVWPLFAMGLYTSGLVGQLLSNGFLALFLLEIFITVRAPASSQRPALGRGSID